MNDSSLMREKMYDTYLKFFEVAGRKRRWLGVAAAMDAILHVLSEDRRRFRRLSLRGTDDLHLRRVSVTHRLR
jgi:hypothetical protein